MIFWPCCCPGAACFKPCECFQRGCELHITSSGWTDNAATDCGGIADRVFNKTHVFTINNIVGTAYGYDCEFTISYDDLILTKLPGGGCICKTQPALYNIEGTLGCTRNEEGGYNLTLVLHFNVPVYDENEGCSPSPCVLEPKWETWTANYELVSGGSSSSPPCDLGPDPLGPYTFNTTPSAQTTCGFGLDGTDAEFTLEWKFCDPLEGSQCALCCSEELGGGVLNHTVQVVIDGIGGSHSVPGLSDCDDCPSFDGTYVLERDNGGCGYNGYFEPNPCDDEWSIDGVIWIRLSTFRLDDVCYWILSMSVTADSPFPGPLTIGIWIGRDGIDESDLKCVDFEDVVLDAIDPSFFPFGPGDLYACDYTTSTATITALP